MENHKLLKLKNKSIDLPQLDFQKVKLKSTFLRTLMLLIPLMILFLIGGLVYRKRLRNLVDNF